MTKEAIMSNIIQSIVFTVLGVVAAIATILTDAGWEIIGLCSSIAIAAVGCLIYELINRKK